jgi:hypothetical protein
LTLLRWSGTDWRAELARVGEVYDIGGSAPNDVWAVGARGFIEHYNGTTWATVPADTREDLYGVWGTSRSNAWVVGANHTVLHWDGRRWSMRGPFIQEGELAAVWSDGPNDVWLAGAAGTLRHWDGIGWTASSAPAGEDGRSPDFLRLWGSGASDVWATANNGLFHWNGKNWASLAPFAWACDEPWQRQQNVGPPECSTLWPAGIWGTGPDDVWGADSWGEVLMIWNGASWSNHAYEWKADGGG